MRVKNCNIIHLSEVSSTNEYAKALLKDRRPVEGTSIVADFQTAGKGQDSNSWESEAAMNILMSMILYPGFLEPSKQFYISMCVALGIADFLDEVLSEEVLIKWPNDLYVNNKKIGGILINNEIMGDSFEYVLVGIGLNVNQTSFSPEIPNPTSLKIICGKPFDLNDEVIRLGDSVIIRYEMLKSGSFKQIEQDYLQKLLGLGEERLFVYQEKKITARITGINEFGHIRLVTVDGVIECDIKEIAYLI